MLAPHEFDSSGAIQARETPPHEMIPCHQLSSTALMVRQFKLVCSLWQPGCGIRTLCSRCERKRCGGILCDLPVYHCIPTEVWCRLTDANRPSLQPINNVIGCNLDGCFGGSPVRGQNGLVAAIQVGDFVLGLHLSVTASTILGLHIYVNALRAVSGS